MDYLILLPILIPVCMGLLLVFGKGFHTSRAYGFYGALGGALTLAAVIAVCMQGEPSLTLFTLSGNLDIYFHTDGTARLFAVLGCVLWILIAFYSVAYFHEPEPSFDSQRRLKRYYVFYLVSLGVIMALCQAGNVITMYMFFEMMTLTTFPFVFHNQTKEAVRGALKYLFFSICGAMTALAGIFFLYQYCDGLKFTPGGIVDAALVQGHEQVVLAAAMLCIIGFGAKAGMFPLHAWLPVAHPVAPAPASALLSGFIAKCGVLTIFRMVFYVVGAKRLIGSWVQYVWMILALATVFMGSMLAYREKILKKRLAYSTVSQISYILFGLSLMNGYGLLGGCLHVVFHSIVKTVLFLFSGVIIHQTGETSVAGLDGLGRRMPVTYVCFTLVSITLVGIPPTSAFMSKLYLCMGAAQSSQPWIVYTGITVLLVSALLTAGYLLSITVKGFYDSTEKKHDSSGSLEPGWYMLAPMVILTVLALGLGLYTQPLMEFLMSFITKLV
ncbi:MAG: proton-conducting membrane transporter [Lachnospiraceae bacterium]|nr:proton-conducting membrane transporter [Lachnospiraceae bacterium]